MAYEFKKLTWKIDTGLPARLINKRGLPAWFDSRLFEILNRLEFSNGIKTTTNFILADWISKAITIIPVAANRIYTAVGNDYLMYKKYKDRYTQEQLSIFLHTFPFDKGYVRDWLWQCDRMERPDLTVVVEQFIAEMGWLDEDNNNRFLL